MVSCRECGREFGNLSTHLRVHGLTAAAYKEKYPGAVVRVISQEQREKISKSTKLKMQDPEIKKKMMDHVATRNYVGENHPRFGTHHSEETKRKIGDNEERNTKIAAKKKEWWNSNVGKTVEELFGEEEGKRIRAIKSEQNVGEKNPAFGKLYECAGFYYSKIGLYKGKHFRSLWEYSFYKYLEKSGIDLADVQHESIVIPYKLKGKNRNYFPDFLYHDQLVEIKSTWELSKKKGSRMRTAKFEAAQNFCKEKGLVFSVLTEKDFRVYGISLAERDPDVVWIKNNKSRRKKRVKS